ncbi:AraC family transcriptional regulator [Tsukamurella sp. PLM1]|uniref:AraC family transcriptional regulator n=1 Tax=Tsukamurella sp. PLM1 TaxID=2929795 RepID=UPI00206B394A|nr:AraC family transcriptional regulator [Tsukamurella sp. PLM1]BDH57199.1 putative transcriptional regulatory, AraC family protein [Tsukamurella sp. PLM1]
MPVTAKRSTPPLSRYAALASYPDLARSLGADPRALMRASGLDPSGVAMQDRWVPASAVNDLLERTAQAAERDDLGLRLAELRRLSHLGPLSLVLREEPDVRSALRLLVRNERMYNEALHTRLSIADGIATIRVELELEKPAPVGQAIDFAVGVVHAILRDLIGGGWSPLSVSFGHPPHLHRETPRRMFGGSLRYDADFSGITLYERDLDRPTTTADPQFRAYTRRIVGAVDEQAAPESTERIRELVDMLLPTGRCSADQVARSIGVDRRTVHRRLAAEGTTFTQVVDDARAALAQHLVAGRRYTFTEIASILAFSSPSNFSRWFRGRFGSTPRAWRMAATVGG